MKQYLLDKIVKRDPHGGVMVQFPLINICGSCHGVIGAFFGPKQDLGKDDAYEIALMQAGFYLNQWQGMNVANASIPVKKCDCRCQHNWQRAHEAGLLRCLDCGILGGGSSDD